MLNMIPKSFSWTFSVMDGSKQVAEAVDLSWLTEKGELKIHGVVYKAYREGMMSGAFVLESPDGVIARAEKPSALRRSLIVEHAGRQYTLRAKSAFRREFLLLDGSSRIGSISPEGIFTRRAAVELPEAWPLPVRMFIIWLTVMLWKQEQAA
jgi:hypothetical protein